VVAVYKEKYYILTPLFNFLVPIDTNSLSIRANEQMSVLRKAQKTVKMDREISMKLWCSFVPDLSNPIVGAYVWRAAMISLHLALPQKHQPPPAPHLFHHPPPPHPHSCALTPAIAYPHHPYHTYNIC